MAFNSSRTRTREYRNSETFSKSDDTMSSLVFRLALTLAAMGVLAGCNGQHTYFRSLSASNNLQDCWSHFAREGYCTGLDKWGASCSSADGQVINKDTVGDLGLKRPTVGFTHKFYPGTQPFACKEVYMWRSRAYVTFDLSKVDPKIESAERLAIATLSWEPSTKRYEQGWAESKNLPPHCFRQLFVATGPVKSFDTPGDWIADLDQNWVGTPPQKITITPFVKKYVGGGFGGTYMTLYFTGSDEGNYGQENRSCNTTLDSLKLDLTYSAK